MTPSINIRVLHSDRLAAVVAPELGGRMLELTDLSSDRQWLWSNPLTAIGPVASGAEYDDVWQGGFEELFPNDAPTLIDSVQYPDHGELWSTPWEVTESGTSNLKLQVTGPVTGVRVTKRFSIDRSVLAIQYSLENHSDRRVDHMFKLHPALDVDEHCRIDLPGGLVEKVDAGFGNLLPQGHLRDWPTEAGLDECRDRSSGTNEFFYVLEAPEGWCGISDRKHGSRIRLEYPKDIFPYCWVFMTYGGWRGHNVVVLEPCTNYPKDLPEAIAKGTSAQLMPGEKKEFEVRLRLGEIDD